MMIVARSLFCAVLTLAPLSATAAEAVFGVWTRNGGHDEKLEFYDCAGKLCAKGVIPLPDGSPPPVILRSATKTAPNQWRGDLFNPENGKIYSGSIQLDSPTQLTLTGCLVAFLCQSEIWTRPAPPTPAPPTPAPRAAKPAPH
jgi:uncharacterized protein (DUF2147 family)